MSTLVLKGTTIDSTVVDFNIPVYEDGMSFDDYKIIVDKELDDSSNGYSSITRLSQFDLDLSLDEAKEMQ